MSDYEIPAIGLSEAATDNIKNIVTRTAGNVPRRLCTGQYLMAV